jgi:hypothetical protein
MRHGFVACSLLISCRGAESPAEYSGASEPGNTAKPHHLGPEPLTSEEVEHQEPPLAPCPGRSRWMPTTQKDIEAIATWIETIHPGPVDPSTPGFVSTWSQSLGLARERAEQVCDRAGWWATLNALLWSLRDGHARLSSSRGLEPVRWTGFAVELQGDRYILRRVADEPDLDRALDGALLVSCDGTSIEEHAERTLDLFRGDWTVPSMRPSMTAALLVDDGNPFVTPPKACTVDVDGREQQWIPSWKVGPWSAVGASIARFQRIKRDNADRLSLEFSDDGSAWITVGNLTDKERHEELRATIAKARMRILRAPYIVWDLRGNGGGDSELGDALAQLVWGKGSLVSARPSIQLKRWRASQELVDYIRSSSEDALTWIIPEMENAVRERQSMMTLERDRPKDDASASSTAAPAATGPVFALTDAGCFSSCIMFRNLLIRMGAIQVGDPTGKNAVNGEVWFSHELPSKLATITLPIANMGEHPEDLGGTPPSIPWHGAADDEAGIRQLIAEAAATHGSRLR